MSLSQILKEFTQKQLKYMKQYGADIVAWFQSSQYEMMLYKDPHLKRFTGGEVKHQIGFQRRGKDFTDMDQVMSKSIPDDISFSELRQFEEKIREWLEKYEKIGVGSNNREKAKQYKRIFNRLGFNVITRELDFSRENIEGNNQMLVILQQ